MRNALPQQSQLNPAVIDEVKNIMQQYKNSSDSQAMLLSFLQNNPKTAALVNVLKSNGNLEVLARQMAHSKNIDIMQLLQQLQGGF